MFCNVTGSIIADEQAGGILGELDAGRIYNCTFTGDIRRDNSSYTAGLVAITRGNIYIKSSTVKADITAKYGASGLVSFHEGRVLQIKDCIFDGMIDGENGSAGFIGLARGTDLSISESSIYGNINAEGGFIGTLDSRCSIYNCSFFAPQYSF